MLTTLSRSAEDDSGVLESLVSRGADIGTEDDEGNGIECYVTPKQYMVLSSAIFCLVVWCWFLVLCVRLWPLLRGGLQITAPLSSSETGMGME